MSTKPQDAQHRPLSEVDKLRVEARSAAEVRALQTHPDVVALRVEKVRKQVDALIWVGLLLGLLFTMANVQTFAAAGAAAWSLPWIAAWLLDPMVSLVLIAVLLAEQVTARWQVEMRTRGTGPWVKRTKVFAFAATYTMNTWEAWADLHLAGIVLHSVPPAMVYLAAETGPILRDRLTEAVLHAAKLTDTDNGGHGALPPVDLPIVPLDLDTETTAPSRQRSRKPAKARKASRRVSRAEYLERARAAYRPGTMVTPAWVREAVPGISRGTSQVVANELRTELDNQHTVTTVATAPEATDPTDSAAASVDGRAA
ncbi:hypothetical protein [Actinophytocola xanthii]|uniref:DUF2637 domain-containing protein n=1 Tax=Actinophytocola xanthii TaxID=1912961 RepID=A0A1Q8CNE1_9PSEU|nr:hypothetical protein [Actinophytocola xanthii]OLF15869.1 hypothetical protein BU204_19310 [Actinophytocola xanthii]